MRSDRWTKIEALYHAAQCWEPALRNSRLREACEGDDELLKEVESLLAADDLSCSLLDRPLLNCGSGGRLETGTVLPPYRVEGILGEGGMGVVYRARDLQLDRDVALKVLPAGLDHDRERLERFRREAKVLAALSHPGIATVYGVVESAGRRAIAMELAPGETLAAVLNRGPLPVRKALRIAHQIAEALEAAHEGNVVHRDLKPGNVMIGPEGKVKLLDFGLATTGRSVNRDADASGVATLTTGMIVGTAAYMSPEQAEGKAVDKRSDIWSFGVVLWEMLTGRRLFDSPAISGILADVLRKEIDFRELPGSVPSAIRTLMRRCLDRNVKTRLRDIGEARVVLGSPEEPVVEGRRRGIWTRTATTAVLTGAVVVTALVVLSMLTTRRVQPPAVRARFSIQQPAGTLTDIELSPDGRFVAWVTVEGGMARRIWVRPLDSPEARLIAEAPGEVRSSIAVFWSRDANDLYYPSRGKLLKVARTGGTATVLAEAPGVLLSGASFEDGTIVYGTLDGLFRISADGRATTRIASDSASSIVALPHRRFLATRSQGVFAASVDRPDPVRVLPEQSRTAYIAPVEGAGAGHLLFVRGERLMAQRFDAATSRLSDEAHALGPVVGKLPGSTTFDAFTASSNGVLMQGRGKSAEAVLTWFDRSGKVLGRIGKPFHPGRNPAIQLSPDDSRALVPIAGSEGTDLWIADLRHDSMSRFTFRGGYSGLWSPDGRSVVWASTGDDRYRKAADGSGGEQAWFSVPNCRGCYLASWSADGKSIASHGGQGDGVAIWLIPLTGDRTARPFLQSAAPKYWLQFSPDGKYIAYVSAETRRPEVFVESLPLGTGRWQVSTNGGDWPVWSRDAKELYFRENAKLMAVAVKSGVPFDGSGAKALFDVFPDTRFQVTREGRFLIAMPVDGGPDWGQYMIDTDCRPTLPRP